MRILHTILSSEYAGSEAYCCQLAALQAHAGDDVTVLIRDGAAAYVARVRREAAPAHVVCLPKFWPSQLEGWAARAILRRLAPRIVHAHLGRAVERIGPVVQRAGIPLIASLHLDWRRSYARCDGIICIAAWQKPAIPSDYAGLVEVVWNWAPPAPAAGPEPEGTPTGGPAEDGVPMPVRFLSVGRLVPNKGMDVLVRAFRQAFPAGDEPVRLAIAGDGPDRRLVAEAGAGDPRIAMLGYVDGAAALYRNADVYVSAARYEPFGLTILEAMQAGCRLVCTETEGPHEFLRGYDVAWAKPGEVESLAAALRAAAVAGRARAGWDLSPFDPGTAVARIRAFYERCLTQTV